MHECRRSQEGESRPLVCPKCGHEMSKMAVGTECVLGSIRVIAIITDPYEVNNVLECLKRNNAPPFNKEVINVS